MVLPALVIIRDKLIVLIIMMRSERLLRACGMASLRRLFLWPPAGAPLGEWPQKCEAIHPLIQHFYESRDSHPSHRNYLAPHLNPVLAYHSSTKRRSRRDALSHSPAYQSPSQPHSSPPALSRRPSAPPAHIHMVRPLRRQKAICSSKAHGQRLLPHLYLLGMPQSFICCLAE